MLSNGRGRGFSIVSEGPAYDDEELMAMLRDRVAKLHSVLALESNGVEQPEDSLRRELENAESRIVELEDSAEEVEGRDAQLLEEVNVILGDIYPEEFSDLSSAIAALIDQYSDAVEEANDEV